MSYQGSILDAVQLLARDCPVFGAETWRVIASEAVVGSAPAQYIVAKAFEDLGDCTKAREWYERSAAKQYRPAISRLATLCSGSRRPALHCF
jgi:TPR repeat protein